MACGQQACMRARRTRMLHARGRSRWTARPTRATAPKTHHSPPPVCKPLLYRLFLYWASSM
eukprot:scaffold3_cov389-Prasinococcus_capsulatus_cf.AAC.14